jgi:hypothetical protein
MWSVVYLCGGMQERRGGAGRGEESSRDGRRGEETNPASAEREEV